VASAARAEAKPVKPTAAKPAAKAVAEKKAKAEKKKKKRKIEDTVDTEPLTPRRVYELHVRLVGAAMASKGDAKRWARPVVKMFKNIEGVIKADFHTLSRVRNDNWKSIPANVVRRLRGVFREETAAPPAKKQKKA
jgi:hypothetical protein